MSRPARSSGGGHRPYDVANGYFGPVKTPEAVELVARASFADLADKAFTGPLAGRARSYAVGANYYFNPNVRIMVNYGITDLEYRTGRSDQANVLQSRVQLTF
ncbi:MAG: porin [Parvibaculaceae bacterium]|nr:porin [Parvibaculaceae bacterium]